MEGEWRVPRDERNIGVLRAFHPRLPPRIPRGDRRRCDDRRPTDLARANPISSMKPYEMFRNPPKCIRNYTRCVRNPMKCLKTNTKQNMNDFHRPIVGIDRFVRHHGRLAEHFGNILSTLRRTFNRFKLIGCSVMKDVLRFHFPVRRIDFITNNQNLNVRTHFQ